MIDKKSIANSINSAIKELATPNNGFVNYMNSKMYEYYINFIEYIIVLIIDDYNLDVHITSGNLKDWGLSCNTISKLKIFTYNLNKFYQKHKNSDDFTLIRDNYWDEFSLEAKKCVEMLEKDIEKMP